MTVSNTSPIITYQFLNAAIPSWPAEFSFHFLLYDESTLSVSVFDSEGVTRTLIYETDYTVLINPEDPDNPGGVVSILQVAAVADGYLTIKRDLPIEQDVDWVNNNAFSMTILEQSFDELTMIIQDQQVLIDGEYVTVNWQGLWQPSYTYPTNQIVEAPNSNWYACIKPHTASSDFDADLATGAWLLILDVEEIVSASDAAVASASAAKDSEDNAKISEDNAIAAAASMENAEANSAVNAQNAANCAQASFDYANGIIESGSNQYGQYIKYSDGTMEQWGEAEGVSIPVDNVAGTLYRSFGVTVNMPVIFDSNFPYVFNPIITLATGYPWITVSGWNSVAAAIFQALSSENTAVVQAYSWRAIGKWS